MQRAVRPVFGSEPPEADAFERTERMVHELWQQRDPARTLGNDPYLARMSEATADLYHGDIQFKYLFTDIISFRMRTRHHPEPLNPSRDANLYHKAVTFCVEDVDGFPFLSVGDWKEVIVDAMSDRKGSGTFLMSMIRDVVTNVEQRYAGVKLPMWFLQERFDHPIVYADVGASLGLGAKQTGLPDPSDHPFLPVVVQGRLAGEQTLSLRANHVLALPVPGHWLGIDRWIPDEKVGDSDAKRWAISNRFRIAEKTPEAVAAYKAFVDLEEPYLQHIELDVLSQPEEVAAALGDKQIDVAVLSTIGNQLTPRQFARALSNLKPYMNPKGLIFVQDFADVSKTNRNGLRFHREWSTYSTFVFDMAHPERRWQHLLQASNGRAIKYTCGLGAVAIRPKDEPRSMEEYLLAA